MKPPIASLTRNRVKSVEFAQPTSDNARKFGYGRKGCWCVHVGYAGAPLVAITGHQSREAALRHAQALASNWDSSFIAVHPDDAARLRPFNFASIA